MLPLDREWAEHRIQYLSRRHTLTEAESREVDELLSKLDADDKRQKSERVRNGYTASAETPTARDAVLQPEHRYSEWLRANHGELYENQTNETRVGSWPSQWDKDSTAKYWRGMTTGTWKNEEPEHRAAMAE